MADKKELVLRVADAEKEAVAAVNGIMHKHSLPCFIFEPIIDKIHRQLIDGKTNELLAARSRLAEQEETTSESNE